MPHEPRPKIPIALPSLGDEEWQALREPITSGWLTQGPQVAAFEKAFADRHAVAHAVAASSCTTALHLVLAAMDVGPGDEVIVPAFTWVATANVVLYCGATPVFVDIDPLTYNIDPAHVAEALTPKTKAILAVHLFGLCADVDTLQEVAGNVPIIEDAACAAGADYKGRPAGSLGSAGCFSFHPRKTITTGEGGMVATNDAALAERISVLRNHGASISEEQRHHGPSPWRLPEFNVLGFNYRMTDLQGAIGRVQLEKLDGFLEERQKWADYYIRELADIPWLKTPVVPADCRHGWQSFVCTVDESRAPLSRNNLMQQLEKQGVSTRPGTHAVHMLNYYRDRFGFAPEDFPHARDCDQDTIALPLHNQMSEEDFAHAVAACQAVSEAGERASCAA